MITIRSANFIGYATLEAWAAAIDPERAVYATKIVDASHGERGLHTDYLRIVCSQPDRDGDVHYFRMTTGNVAYILDQPLSGQEKADQVIAGHDQAWLLVRDWLSDSRLVVRQALVATPPADWLRLLDGWPEFLVFDKTRREFAVKES